MSIKGYPFKSRNFFDHFAKVRVLEILDQRKFFFFKSQKFFYQSNHNDMNTIPKYHLPDMPMSNVIGNKISRFPAMLSVLCQIQESYRSIYGSLRLR